MVCLFVHLNYKVALAVHFSVGVSFALDLFFLILPLTIKMIILKLNDNPTQFLNTIVIYYGQISVLTIRSLFND